MRDLNSDITVTGEQRRITSEADFDTLFAPGYDIVALCADQPPSIRRWANRSFHHSGVPWVVGGYHGPIASTGLHSPVYGACWECLHDQDADAADMRFPPGMSLDDLAVPLPWNPANIVSAAIVGNFLTHFVLAALTGAPSMEPGFRYEILKISPSR